MIRFVALLLGLSLLSAATAKAKTCAELVQIARGNTHVLGAAIPGGQENPYDFIQLGDSIVANQDYIISFPQTPAAIEGSCFHWVGGAPKINGQGNANVFKLPFHMMAFSSPDSGLPTPGKTWAPNVKFTVRNDGGSWIAPRWKLRGHPTTTVAGTTKYEGNEARIGIWTTQEYKKRLLVVVCTGSCETIFDYYLNSPLQAEDQEQEMAGDGIPGQEIAEPALSIRETLVGLVPSELVNLKIATEGGDSVDPATLQISSKECTYGQTSFVTVLQSLYSQDCLQFSNVQDFTLKRIDQEWTEDGSRLNVTMIVTPRVSPYLSSITLTPPAQHRTDLDCVIDYRLTDAQTGQEIKREFFNAKDGVYTNEIGATPPVKWSDVNLEILPGNHAGSNCIPDTLESIPLANLRNYPNISLDSRGNLTISGLGIRSNRKELHIILNTAAGTLENSGSGTRVNYPWPKDARDLQTFTAEFIVDAMTAYQELGYDMAIVHAVGENDQFRQIGDYGISATANRFSVATDLFDALQPRNVEYSDAAVGLYLQGLFLDDDKVLLFGRSGFTEERSGELCGFSQNIRDLNIDLSALTLSKTFGGATLEKVGITENQRESFIPFFGCDGLSGAGNVVVFPQKIGASETDRRNVYSSFLDGAKIATQDFSAPNQPNNGE